MSPAIRLSSPAFAQGAAIPRKHTCDGADVSPPLEWQDVPSGTRSLVVTMDDPDAPRGTWVHWMVLDLPADTKSLREGGPLPQGTKEGRNDFDRNGYGGPCPPPGRPHRYFLRLHALDRATGLEGGASRDDLDDAMKGHILGQGELMGTYGR